MTFKKQWKSNWELKSLTFEEVFKLVTEILTKQLDEIDKNAVSLEVDMETEYEADSVDIAGMLLLLEDLYKKPSQMTKVHIPTHLLREIILVEDFFDVIYQVLLEMEQKLSPSDLNMLKPDYSALARQKKIGQVYP